ncbi:hypothetical protein OEA41_002845 [Lepraria neglecta]|uniref:Endothelin-converting enzyme 1 n=1 Tax=Lepraria neglecta TaxID=209136 RepID=A0AAD9Z504_9LECA|nr:hypothetical protein OEA41_002845 [Lepraria neglecta]
MNNPKTSAKPAGICLTPACVLAASEILENMSPRYHEIDPCTNFDKFVCEGWAEKHDLRADQGSSFTGTIMAENSQQILRHVLESPYPIDSQNIEVHSVAKQKIFEKLHDTYEACMSEGIIKEAGSAPLLGVLRKIEELFPASRPHEDHDSFPASLNSGQKGLLLKGENNLSKTMAYLTSIGVGALVTFDADDKDPDVVIPFVNAPRQPGLPSKEYYKDPMTVVKYAKTIGQVLEALLQEADPHSDFLESMRSHISTKNAELVEDLVVFESKLAKATPATEEAEDVTKYYNPLNLDETTALMPQLSIQYLISTLATSDYQPDKLIVGSPSYLKTVSKVLQDTSVETLQAYFVWKAVQAYAYKIEDDALKPLIRFNNELQGKDPDASEERWRTCIKVADNGLGWILSKFFIEKAFSAEAKDFGDRIVSDIKAQFIKKLKGAEWMSKDVRKLGIEKVTSEAFDSTGRHYDETGNFTDWWDDKTVHSFKDKAQCFIDQYHDFTVPNPNGEPLHVNGRLTLGENIADAGGLNAAFAAWKQIDADEPEKLLPGLQDFSKEQMFFISYSNWWCGKTRPETAVNLVYRDPHSPTWARILVSLIVRFIQL